MNVANVLSKLSSLKRLLSNISNESNKPNFICVSETHLSESKDQGYTSEEITNLLPGYKFFHYDRQTKKGGGVGIFVQDNLAEEAKVVPDFFQEEIFEGITLMIPNFPFKSGIKNLVVLTAYRQPGDSNIAEFQTLLQKWFDKYDKNSNEIIITGDLNLDLLKYDLHAGTADYLDTMVSHNLLPIIT